MTKPKTNDGKKTIGRPKGSKNKGRPKGSKTRSVVADSIATRCPKCGSSERESYIGSPRVVASIGIFQGIGYNQVTFRRCACKCGQIRIEKSYELLKEKVKTNDKRKQIRSVDLESSLEDGDDVETGDDYSELFDGDPGTGGS